MDFFGQFFLAEQAGQPYANNWEAVGEIRSLVDLCLNLLFWSRDVEAEWLDMRGGVIQVNQPGQFTIMG